MSTPWCPVCREVTEPTPTGTCAWCDAAVVPKRGMPSGIYRFLSDEQVHACYALYRRGLSVRQVAEAILPHTRFTSVVGCQSSLFRAFARLRLPLRDRIEATVLASRTHGLAPKHGPRPGYETYRRRVLRGRQDRPRCAGVKTQAPRLGQRCQLRAMHGSAFCHFHDHARRELVLERVRHMRAHMGRAA